MSVSLKIDHRETKLKDLLQTHDQNKLNIVYDNLDFGDLQLLVDNTVHFIFERKSISDLIASIKDGRYKNQKAKVLEFFKPSQVYYIIEGVVKWSGSSQNDKMVQGAMIGMLLRDKFGVFQTKNVEDTLAFILGMYERVRSDPNKYIQEQQNLGVVVSDLKVTQATPKECYFHMLCQIPDVSQKTAQGIIEKFPTFSTLFKELSGKTSKEQTELFANVKTIDTGRKISQKAIKNIIQYLLE